MKVIRPLEQTNGPTIFLAGPIQSAPDWHSDAVDYLTELYEKLEGTVEFDIASPKMLDKPEEFYYDKQVAWESHYLKNSADKGVILFWLANPIPEELDPTRSYAQTTRFELSEWFGKSCYDESIKIVVGIEPGFHGERYIKQRLRDDSGIWFFDNLKDTCHHAVNLMIQK